ncbi:DeoR/GlpR family DNA-binding transcription regulator [Streptomyces sp. HNM0663]|uniref:DeoR/GlpR family DNA-binding transcription regulator n=1 Tax=Streptomyces chengmaiensis TaxID=3040919 RepID=A0ABT6HX58_9ACTN|nr:DeoR/GlpR family DNA-binding transcription regulator [Streptomyces chengmaiensis]MDH2393291.1 DeoR/GlpR family DNA-binding transcription regulator [Streptomyces chengmaiensis]
MGDQGLLAQQRRALIVEAVQREGAVRVSDLVETLGVSDMTIRRDLDALAQNGTVEKVHGGAVIASGSAQEPGFDAKSVLESAAKADIADAAAGLVQPGSVVSLGGGTTTYAVAKRLLSVPNLTILTNSLPIEQLFRNHSASSMQSPAVLLTGGASSRSQALVGPIAEHTIMSLHTDLLILGTHGVTEAEGLTSPSLAESQTNRVFISRARRMVLAADHTKWGMIGLSSFARLDQVNCFITDAGMPQEAVSLLAERVGELVVAGSDGVG